MSESGESTSIDKKEAALRGTLQDLVPWKLLVLASIVVAVVAELFSVATRTADHLSEAKQAGFRGKEAEDSLGPEMPDIPKTIAAQKKLKAGRTLYRNEIRAERARGLRWFAFVTAVAIWCTGILTKDNALAP